MKISKAFSSAAAILLAGALGANAQSFLQEIAVNVGGNWSDWQPPDSPAGTGPTYTGGTGAPGSVNFSAGMNPGGNGLGTISYSISAAGSYSFLAFLDLEANGTDILHDTASANGSTAAGQTWEIGDPTDTSSSGIFAHFSTDTLINGVSGANPGDIATAMGFDFTVPAGDTAVVELTSSSSAPGSGFYLQQTGSDGTTEYLSGSVTISPAGTGGSVPDSGSTLSALALAFAGLAGLKSKLGRS